MAGVCLLHNTLKALWKQWPVIRSELNLETALSTILILKIATGEVI